ncbi:hypothetical protein OSTOST_01211 [Ostertagia ostertagi]
MQHPFSLKEAKHGENTVCTIMAEMSCGSDVLIGERCFSYDADARFQFADEKCKMNEGSELHTVTSTFEQKWISTFFSSYGMMWVKNNATELSQLLVEDLGEGRALGNKEARIEEKPVKQYVIVLRKGTVSHLRPGSLVPAHVHQSFIHE